MALTFKTNSFIKYKDAHQYGTPCGYAKIIGTIPGSYKSVEGLLPVVELPEHDKAGTTVAAFEANYNADFVKVGNIANYKASGQIFVQNPTLLSGIEAVVDVLPNGSTVKIMHSSSGPNDIWTVSKNTDKSQPGFLYKGTNASGGTIYFNNEEIRSVVFFGKEKVIDNSNFMKMISSDANDMMYRVAAAQLNKVLRQSILAYLKKQGSKRSEIKTIAMLLDSEAGEALLSMIMGMALTYAPGISGNDKAATLAEEFRVSAFATAGNTIVDTVMGTLFPVIMGALSSINETQQEQAQLRVEAPKEEAPKAELIEEILSSSEQAQMKA